MSKIMKVVCKKVISPTYRKKTNKSWTKGKTYIVTETGYNKFSIRDNSGVSMDLSSRELHSHFDIIK